MVEQGFLTDETEHLPEMQANVSEVAISSITVDDRQWAYPLWTSDNFLFYNRTLLEEAGFAAPGPTSEDRLTWEEVVEISRAVVESGDAPYGIGMDQVDRYYALQPLLESLGAGPGLEGPDALVPAVNTAEWERFGEWYGALYAEGLAPRGVDPAQMVDLFRAGQSAFLLGGASAIGQIVDGDFPGEWGMAPHPFFADGPIVTPTDSWAIGVSATSEHQDLARDFVQFATLDPQGAQLASSVNTLPPVQFEAFDGYVGYIQELAPEQTAHFGELFLEDTENHSRHRPTSAGYVQFESEMNNAFSDIRNGANPRRVLDNAQEALERQLDRLRELAVEAEGNER
jgi:ABC-type glycerol-3-phosphate transport system substrate-binding protein